MNEHYEDYDDDLLRHYYELELEVLRRGLRAFARRNPNEAARLSIGSDARICWTHSAVPPSGP